MRPVRQPRNLADLALRQADQSRTDLAAIADDLEFILAQVSKVPTGRELAWVAVGSFVGGAAVATLVTLVFIH